MSERYQEDNQPPRRPQRPTPRQAFKRRIGAIMLPVAMLAGAGNLINSARAEGKDKSEETAKDSSEVQRERLQPVFSDARAEKIARDLDLDPGGYFKVRPETIAAIETQNAWLKAGQTLPIVPEAVGRFAPQMEAAAADYGLPPSYLAFIATMESGGDTSARSNTDARGILQVEPVYHTQRFVDLGYLPEEATYKDYRAARSGQPSQLSLQTYTQAFEYPAANAQVSADIFHEYRQTVRNAHPELNPESPLIYALTAAAYNGGTDMANNKPFDAWPLQAQLYSDSAMRFIIDAEIAARLRNEGLSDPEIRKAMHSDEIDARAYAWVGVPKNWHIYDDIDISDELCSKAEPGLETGQTVPSGGAEVAVYQGYHAYKEGRADRHYDAVNPALRIRYAESERRS